LYEGGGIEVEVVLRGEEEEKCRKLVGDWWELEGGGE